MSTKPKVIVDPHFRTMSEAFSPQDRERLGDIVDVIWGKNDPMPQDDFLQALPEAEVVVCAEWRYGDVLAHAKKLRAIFTISGGFPLELDYDYCHKNYIRVLSAAPAFGRQVAEMCLGLALSASRDIATGDRQMRAGGEPYLHDGNKNTFMLYGKTVGIIGYGNIARELHPLIKPFGVNVLAYDPWLGDRYLLQQGVEPTTLVDLLERSQVIFVLASPTKENVAMLSRKHLQAIQKHAVLVLASRAHVVDFDAMTEMVLNGDFKVATDVFPTEPLSADHPIRRAEKAVLSAHRAGSVQEGLWEIGEMVLDDLEVVSRGLPPRRLQIAEFELSQRFAMNRAKTPEEAQDTT
ncbi:MAG: NAD(P)-dependent oxidoreductase [Chloroflexota bacterium]